MRGSQNLSPRLSKVKTNSPPRHVHHCCEYVLDEEFLLLGHVPQVDVEVPALGDEALPRGALLVAGPGDLRLGQRQERVGAVGVQRSEGDVAAALALE